MALFIVSMMLLLLFPHEEKNSVNGIKYEPTWDSLDKRPLPQWYDDAKIGIFLHWGVYAVPSYGVGAASSSEWFWAYWKGHNAPLEEFMENYYPKGFTYQEFANDFTAEFFNASEWAELFKTSGAKYVVLTSKHHEGFTLWPSKYTFGWNSVDIGPHKDIVGELSKATRNEGLEFGLYYSMYEWYNPLYRSDRANNFTTQEFVMNKYIPEITSLVEIYSPSVIWVDGEWEADYTYWNSTYFLAWLYNESLVKDYVVVNDRWGKGLGCKHGDFYSCADRYDPRVLQKHKWESTVTTDKHSWGFRRNAILSDFMSSYELIQHVARTVSCGGNILINIGPTKEGTIIPLVQERLKDLGNWLKVAREAVYKSKPWKFQNDTDKGSIWYTMKEKNVYAFILEWPETNVISLRSVKELFQNSKILVKMLGYDGKLEWILDKQEVDIFLPNKGKVKCDFVWVIKLFIM